VILHTSIVLLDPLLQLLLSCLQRNRRNKEEHYLERKRGIKERERRKQTKREKPKREEGKEKNVTTITKKVRTQRK